MKNLFKLTLILSTLLGVTACEPESGKIESEKIDVIFLVDNTEKTEDRNSLFSAESFYKNYLKSTEQLIRIPKIYWSFLTDVSQNKMTELEFKPLDIDTETNLTDTRNKLKSFKEEIMTQLSSTAATHLVASTGKPMSSIYMPLKKFLTKSKNSESDKTVIVIFSDMIEHSNCANMYGDNTKSVEQIVKDLEKCGGKFPSASNVEVVVVYQPKDSADDARFQKTLKVWKVIFKEAGIEFSEAKSNI